MTTEAPAPLAISVTTAAEIIGISRSAAYSAVHRGDLPSVRINNRLFVPRAPLLAMFGVEAQEASGARGRVRT